MIKNVKKILQPGILKDFPGGQFCIITKDSITCDYIGYKELNPNVLCDGSEIYDVASLTKVTSTTTMILKLIEDGKLSLKTNVKDILPEFKYGDITIRDLMIHSSGLPADISRANKLKSREEVIKKAYEAELIYEKGSRIVYSDIGYIILGLIIEKITQKPLNIFAEEVIFKPLNMKDTNYHPNINRAAPTEYRDDEVYQGLLRGKVHDEKSFAMSGISGHAGLFSTAYDLGLFIQSILNNQFVFSKETTDLMFESQLEVGGNDALLRNRALGWDKPVGDQNNIITHTGFTGCNMWINRQKGLGFVLLTNGVHPKRTLNNIFPYRNQINEKYRD